LAKALRKTAEISDYSSASGKTCRVNLAHPAISSAEAGLDVAAMIGLGA
jgi:hypothetical protein